MPRMLLMEADACAAICWKLSTVVRTSRFHILSGPRHAGGPREWVARKHTQPTRQNGEGCHRRGCRGVEDEDHDEYGAFDWEKREKEAAKRLCDVVDDTANWRRAGER